ncbi:hypothetical protein RQP46_010451 [Phenoliferia psychrophenolica]
MGEHNSVKQEDSEPALTMSSLDEAIKSVLPPSLHDRLGALEEAILVTEQQTRGIEGQIPVIIREELQEERLLRKTEAEDRVIVRRELAELKTCAIPFLPAPNCVPICFL